MHTHVRPSSEYSNVAYLWVEGGSPAVSLAVNHCTVGGVLALDLQQPLSVLQNYVM